MTRYFFAAFISLAAISGAPGQDLFNGKDLNGWDGNPEFWSVQDGVIVGETTAQKKTAGNTFLIWKGGEVGDFELTLKARVIGKNNSGIQYRSKVLDAKKWSVGGYQMDMHPAPNYFGMLYEEKGRGIIAQRGQKVVLDEKGKKSVAGKLDTSKKLDLSKWNEFTVIAKGNTLIHKVNGDVTSEVVDDHVGKRALKGIIALQLHAGGPMRLEAKDIVLKKSDTAGLGARPLSTTPTAALVAQVKVDSGNARVHPKGFEVEKIYNVPKGQQGSWVSMAVDAKGRLYCSDQGRAGIWRITLGEPLKVEKVPAPISGGHGLLWAFDRLYVCVNGGGVGGHGSGLYYLTDSNGDDQLDKVTSVRGLQGGGEHGPHAVVLTPDGKSLMVIGGNHTKPPNPETYSVPKNYAEDLLLPRMVDARGHARGIRAPGGWIAKTDPDGKSWNFYSSGFRNQYDVAFNADGEMFTYDSDMEWDSGTPWYRPTRVYHCTSGSEFGWRTGTGKWPAWYPDCLPPAIDIGPGCPTGVMSGQGAKFPADYQHAIYVFDWTYGTIYAIHMAPNGSSYQGVKEEFITGVPLNVTDGVIGKDGNMYFAVGGRGTQSSLYRVTYKGELSTKRRFVDTKLNNSLRKQRREMESFHGREVDGSIEKIWKNLGHKDRFLRYAARIALEHQPVSDWADRALGEKNLQASLTALLALTRQGDQSHQADLLESLSQHPQAEMSDDQKLESLRVLALCFIRMGKPDEASAKQVIASISPLYPAKTDALNRELVDMLVYLGSPEVVAKTVPLLNQEAAGLEEIEFDDALLKRSGRYGNSFLSQKANNPQRQQIHYAFALKNVSNGWTPALRKQFFTWFAKARNFKGGASFGGFIENFRKESLKRIEDAGIRAEMDALSKQRVALVPAGYESARKIQVGVKPGMKFDTESISAKAGEKVAIVLLNNDPTGLMHNLAVCAPGSRQKVMEATLAIGAKAIEQNFIPDIPEVLASTPQVAPNRKYILYMTVPSEPGDYPYICTYPGHAQLMHGTLKVTR
ncbi:MAG: family 16 glycoside hydrolase [Verrucomicrobiota bacterium]|nr:family 16 glycoside hydrolase [Verrucomicrobiota bacterium]